MRLASCLFNQGNLLICLTCGLKGRKREKTGKKYIKYEIKPLNYKKLCYNTYYKEPRTINLRMRYKYDKKYDWFWKR